jgi:hypothetical protein
MNIEWTQVIVAFLLGVFLSAMVKSTFSGLKSKVGGA